MEKGKLIKKYIAEYAGYGKNDPRSGSHLKKRNEKGIVSTITTLSHFNKVVVEIYEVDDNKEIEK